MGSYTVKYCFVMYSVYWFSCSFYHILCDIILLLLIIVLPWIYVSLLWPQKARPVYFTAVIYFSFFYFIIHQHRWNTSHGISNQTWLVGRKCCRFTNALPKKIIIGDLSPNLKRKTSNFGPLFRDFCTKMLVSICNVSPYKLTYFPNLWHWNGWDAFASYDPPFGDHYVATIKVATSLTSIFIILVYRLRVMCLLSIIHTYR